MTKKLFYQAILKFMLGAAAIGALLFLPAGTFRYWNAWLFMGILFVPMLFTGIVMMLKNPELLRKRLNAREQQSEQSLVIKLSGLMFVLGFVRELKMRKQCLKKVWTGMLNIERK